MFSYNHNHCKNFQINVKVGGGDTVPNVFVHNAVKYTEISNYSFDFVIKFPTVLQNEQNQTTFFLSSSTSLCRQWVSGKT